MKLPETTPQQILEDFMRAQPVHRTSTDTAMTTPGAVATVLIAAVCWSAISPWWLLLAVPLSAIAWGSEVKWWRRR